MRMTRFVVRGESFTEYARYGKRSRTKEDDELFEREDKGLPPIRTDNWGHICVDGVERDGCAGRGR